MGNSASSPLGSCLLSAVGGDHSLIASSSSNLLYQLQDVKPYNLDIMIHPTAVTYPKTDEQVAAIVQCASSAGLKVQARGGGHSYANYCIGGKDGAVVVDLKHFQDFSMNNSTYEATIGAGTLLADVTTRLVGAGNRAIAHGTCPQVGIGGHATIGGLGPLSRQWGSALDHVISVKAVMANSSILTASYDENPDLFFALKGAAAGFAIITEFTVKTHPAPSKAVEYSYAFEPTNALGNAATFRAWQTLIARPDLPREFASQLVITPQGIVVSGTYFGSENDFSKLDLDSIFSHAQHSEAVLFKDWLGIVGDWAENLALKLVGGIPTAFYSKNFAFTPSTLIPSDGIDALFKYIDTAKKGTLVWLVIFDLAGGAINDVPQNATAYAHRDALYYMQSYAVGLGTVTTTTTAFLDGISKSITDSMPQALLGSYAGYVDPELGDGGGQKAYWGTNLDKLEELKSVFDPSDVFSNPQSVRPASKP